MEDQFAPPPKAEPVAIDGIEYVEFSAPDPAALGAYLEQLGFRAVARHRSKQVLLYRQGDINFVVNSDAENFTSIFGRQCEAAICAVALRVKDAAAAWKQVVAKGAWDVPAHAGVMELNIPALFGVGGTQVHLVDRYGDHTIYDVDFVPIAGGAPAEDEVGLVGIDHVTFDVAPGRMDEWIDFFSSIFGFQRLGAEAAGATWIASPGGTVKFKLDALARDDADADDERIASVTLRARDLGQAAAKLRERQVIAAEAQAEVLAAELVPPFRFEIIPSPSP